MKRVKILLADNDRDFLKTRQEILESEGYEVITASNPEEAMNKLEHDSIGLAIVDLRLRDDSDDKDLSGLMIIKKVAPQVPKILLTAHATVEVTRRALKSYFDDSPVAVDIITKGEGDEALLRVVGKVLEKHVRDKQRRRFLIKVTLGVFFVVLAVSFLLVFVFNLGTKEVFIAVLSGLVFEIVAALLSRTILEK